MIGILIFPILICGYLYISCWPTEKIKISLYHGYSLYIRAAAIGFIIFSILFSLFGYLLPKLGFVNIFSYISSAIEQAHVFRVADTPSSNTNIDIASVSIFSIFFTWVTYGSISIIVNSNRRSLKFLSRILFLEGKKTKSIKKIFYEKSPIEYQLLVITDQLPEDLAYNNQISRLRTKAYIAIRRGYINRKKHQDLKDIFEELRYREINYALITLENEKFYIGVPQTIPEPDEESVKSTSIQILPVASGYRNEEKELLFTTEYDFDLSDPNHFDCVSIPRDRILSSSGFSFGTYKRLQRVAEKRKG